MMGMREMGEDVIDKHTHSLRFYSNEVNLDFVPVIAN